MGPCPLFFWSGKSKDKKDSPVKPEASTKGKTSPAPTKRAKTAALKASGSDPKCPKWVVFFSGDDEYLPKAYSSKKKCERTRKEELDANDELKAAPCTCVNKWRADEVAGLRSKIRRKRGMSFEDKRCVKKGMPPAAFEYSGSVVSELLAVAVVRMGASPTETT